MAAGNAHYFVCSILIYTCLVHLSIASSSQPEGKTQLASSEEVFRSKRELVCADDVYQHEGRNCCLCGAGQRVEQHCTTKPDDGVCVVCEKGTYSSHPNSRTKCEPCTSCSQSNANLEVAEACTAAKNAVCRCKTNHYCEGQNCKICQPCQECAAGVKEACNATSNTVCKEEVKEGNSAPGWVIPVVVVVVVLIVVAGGVIFWRKRRGKMDGDVRGTAYRIGNDVEMQHLHDVELRPLLPDIVKVLVWKDVQDIAIRSNMPESVIDSCKRNNPQDSEEQKYELLMKWEEKQGRGASRDLIDILERSGEKGKLEKISKILKEANTVRGNGCG